MESNYDQELDYFEMMYILLTIFTLKTASWKVVEQSEQTHAMSEKIGVKVIERTKDTPFIIVHRKIHMLVELEGKENHGCTRKESCVRGSWQSFITLP